MRASCSPWRSCSSTTRMAERFGGSPFGEARRHTGRIRRSARRGSVRILLLSQFYPPVAGGVENHVAELAETLADRGHDVAVGVLDGGETQTGPALVTRTVTVRRLPSTTGRLGMLFTTDRRHAPPIADPETMLALRRLVAEFSPEIVHAHNWIGRSFAPLARRSGAKYVETLHD
ncbi:hypothetical protein EG835_14240, partial [bacterium]|nr:hypothetical protein [bacterium]